MDTTPRRDRSTVRLATAVLALIVLFLAVRAFRGGRVEEPDAVTPPPAGSSAAPFAAGPGGGAPAPPVSINKDAIAKAQAVARIEKAIDDYKAAAIYPVSSRPHDEGTGYLLKWNEPVVSTLPLHDQEGRETYYRFAADRAHVTYGETLTSWIEAWEGNDPSKRVPLKISEAYVVFDSGPKQGPAIPLVFTDTAGDRKYVNKFSPAEAPGMKQALQAHLAAVIEFAGARRLVIRDFTYAPRDVMKVLAIEDSIGKEGELVVTLSVDVKERGLHTFQANVMSGNGETPIGWVDESRTLEVGPARVELHVFGKIFTDKGVDGPYLVRDVRGFLRFLDGSEQNVWWHHDPTHLTKPYKTVDFSSKEWDAPEKRQKIAAMKQLADDVKTGKLGGPANSGGMIIDNPPAPAASK